LANYNVTSKVLVGDRNTVGVQISEYLNSLDASKVVRGLLAVQYGTGILVVIIHDA
jgi:hypothetical protein